MGIVFFEDVVLDSFNKPCRVKDGILDQIHEKQICSDLYLKILIYITYHENAHNKSSIKNPIL